MVRVYMYNIQNRKANRKFFSEIKTATQVNTQMIRNSPVADMKFKWSGLKRKPATTLR